MQILKLLTIVATMTVVRAQPIEVSDAVVEIEKQRLVKFPDEVDQRRESSGSGSDKKDTKLDEAQRILQEIEKINHALGYVRKQPEQSRLPPILDSSQYLFPQPAMHPFHQQHHQASGTNGGTILTPSIRSVQLDQQYITPYLNSKSIEFNTPPRKKQTNNKSLSKYNGYVFRPKEVLLPVPLDSAERQQLPTHFVIPVRLYTLNKEEYIHKNAPQEYRVNGYKIVGDVNNFYGKAKQKKQGVDGVIAKFKPKYHLFFLPREVALAEGSKPDISYKSQTKIEAKEEHQGNNSREEKVIGIQRPFKIQSTATTSSNGGSSSSNVTTQIIRKRIIPKPLREKEPNASELSDQQLPFGGNTAVVPNSHTNTNAHTNLDGNLNNKPTVNNNPTHNSNVFNMRPSALNIPGLGNIARPNAPKNTTAGNVIKNAFQNIFKFPFLQDSKPDMTTDESAQISQMSSKPLLTAQVYQPAQPFYGVTGTQQPQKGSDYHWDDETSNSASDDVEDNSTEHEEKHILGHRPYAEHQTQMEAVKQGGIIIQRLKVRKGGIAIAGPGGVATAGSGGTAIVGPGGYALTHPRSLTIAGPGAKVIAIPSSVDLRDALQRTNLSDQSIPREGKIVATGPTVYYSPATGTGSTSEDDYQL